MRIKKLAVKEGYYSLTDNIVLFFSGLYNILDVEYLLFFVANKENTIYDTFLCPPEAVTWETDKIIVKSNIEEIFIKGGK